MVASEAYPSAAGNALFPAGDLNAEADHTDSPQGLRGFGRQLATDLQLSGTPPVLNIVYASFPAP
jgi:hypothetical protein